VSNPFAPAAESASESAAPIVEAGEEASAPEVLLADDAEAPEVSVDEDTEFGSFERADKAKQQVVPYTRLAKVIHERNALRDNMSEAEKSLAHVQGKLSALQKLEGVFVEKYQTDPDLAKFDAAFMETFDRLATSDPSLAQAAAKVKAAMGVPVTEIDNTNEAAAPAAPAAPASSPAVQKLLLNQVKTSFNEALGEHIKPHFVEAVVRDVMTELSAEEVAEATPEEIVEMAKVYFKSTNTPPSEYMAPAKGNKAAPKPSTKGSQGAPAARSAASAEPAAETPKFKTREEFDAARSKRFAAITKELFEE